MNGFPLGRFDEGDRYDRKVKTVRSEVKDGKKRKEEEIYFLAFI